MGKKTYMFVALMILAIGLRLMFLKPQPSNCPVPSRSDWKVPSWGYSTSPDSLSYLGYVRDIFRGENLINPTRTPVYPLFLAINFILFGYMNLQAIAISQFFLSIMSVALLYLIMLHLTKSPLVSFVTGFIFACDYKLMLYEPMILTEALTTFMVLVVVGAFLWAIYGKFATIKSVVLSLSILTLIFLRPNYIFLLGLAPLIPIVISVQAKTWQPFKRFILPFVAIAILPFLVWCFAIKIKYGFFSVSNVSHIDLLGIVLEKDLYKDASPKYDDIKSAITNKIAIFSSKDITYHNHINPYYFIDLVRDSRPHYCPADFSGVGRFAISAMLGNPKKYAGIVFSQLPLGFSYTSGLRIVATLKKQRMIEDGLAEPEREALFPQLFHQTRNFVLYKICLFAHTVFIFGIFMAFVGISMMLLLPLIHQNDFFAWVNWLVIVSFVWATIFLVTMVSYADFNRYLVPIHSLMIMMFCYLCYRMWGNPEPPRKKEKSMSEYEKHLREEEAKYKTKILK